MDITPSEPGFGDELLDEIWFAMRVLGEATRNGSTHTYETFARLITRRVPTSVLPAGQNVICF